MSEGVINSSSGAHEHKTDIESGLVNKDKSTYTQQSVELQQQNIRKRKPQNRYFEEQKYYDDNIGIYYGLNDESHNVLSFDRKIKILKNPNGVVLGTPDSGKTQKNERSVANGNFSNDVRYKKNIQNGYRGTKITADNKNKSVSDSKLETGIKGVSYNDNITSQEVRYHETAASQNVEDPLHSSASSSSQRVGDYLKSSQAVSPLHRNQLLTKVKSGSGSTFKKVRSSIGTAVTGTSFLANAESFQQTDTGESSINAIKKSADHVVNKLDKLSAKSGKSRYFRTAAKTSDSVTFVSHADRLKNAVYKGQQFGKKGLGAVSKGLNPLVKTLNLSDDVGAQSMVKAVDVTRGSVNAAKMSFRTTKQAVQATSKATRYTVNHARIGLENAAKYSKQAISKSKKAAKIVSKTAQTVAHAAAETAEKAAAAVSRFISFVISNPVTIIIAVVVLLLVIIIAFSSTIVGAGQYFSYGGVGDSNTLSLNDYSAVYDYINESIATRCLNLFNLHDTWTGFLKYDYKYEIENDDGSITTTIDYPIADVAPIMAYLSITHQSYTLNQSLKNEIDNIVNGLYTFTYVREPYSYSVDHGSGNVTTYYGEKITYTIRYHNAAKYMVDNNLIPQEKMSVYNAVKSYGDTAYFKMYNVLKDKNWHEWIKEQYGYSLVGTVEGVHNILRYSLQTHGYIQMNYKNSANENADKIYSPINGMITDIVLNSEDDEYDFYSKITIKDSENDFEFQIISDTYNTLIPTVSVGNTVTAGQLIANNSDKFRMSCLSNGSTINPMLIMEYYQHAA